MAGGPDKGSTSSGSTSGESVTPTPAPGGTASPKPPRPAPAASKPATPKTVKTGKAPRGSPSAGEIRKAARSGNPKKAASAVAASARYTPPTPRSEKVSPIWVPIAMFGLLGLGMLLIFLNYISWPFGDPSNARLIIGLVLILAGILVATQYR